MLFTGRPAIPKPGKMLMQLVSPLNSMHRSSHMINRIQRFSWSASIKTAMLLNNECLKKLIIILKISDMSALGWFLCSLFLTSQWHWPGFSTRFLSKMASAHTHMPHAHTTMQTLRVPEVRDEAGAHEVTTTAAATSAREGVWAAEKERRRHCGD